MMYGSWDMEREGQSVLSFWVIFCPFTPQFAKSKFWKNEKKPGDIIVLHKCTINDNHIMHGSWDMEYQEQSFLSFWNIFCSLTPLKIPKMKILKKRKNTTTTTKKCLEIISFYMCTVNDNHMMYRFWDLEQARHFLSFWTIFCPFKTRILINWKKHLEISSFYTCVPIIMITWCMIPACRMDGKTDRQMDWWTVRKSNI